MTPTSQPVAVVTGASRGLGAALAVALEHRGWQLVIDARNARDLAARLGTAVILEGDVTDPAHRADILAAVNRLGRLDLLVNNASSLGPSPLPTVADHPIDALRAVIETNVVAPVGLLQLLLPTLRESGGAVVNVSSDAAVEPYPTWGGYGASKAALDQLTRILAAEETELAVYAVDPGDMRTAMHQSAFPDEDISDRPTPESVVPALLRLLELRPASGRYRAADFALSEVRS